MAAWKVFVPLAWKNELFSLEKSLISVRAQNSKGLDGQWAVFITLGLLLLVAAALKGRQLAASPVMGDGLLDSRWLLIATVEFELLFGLWLLAGLLPRLTCAAAVGCFSMFAAVSLYKAAGGAASCGCFGPVEVNPWYTFMLDAAAVLALLRWRPAGLSRLLWSKSGDGPVPFSASSSFPVARTMAVLIVWLSIGIPAAVAMGTYQPAVLAEDGVILGSNNLVVLEPNKWTNDRFPLLRYTDIGNQISDGDWVVVLFRHDCQKCQKVINDLYETAGWVGTSRIALLELPPYGDVSKERKNDGIPIVQGRVSNQHVWFVRTPVFITLRDGQVLLVTRA